VTREGAACGRKGKGVPVPLLVLEAGVARPDAPPDKFPNGEPVAGARGRVNLGVAPETAGGLGPKREPGVSLTPGADGASVLGSGFGKRLNEPGLIPANGLGAVAVTGFGASVSSAVTALVSGFGTVPSEKPLKSSVGGGVGVGVGAEDEVEGLLLRGTPLVVNRGGVFGLNVDAASSEGRSTKGSTLTGGGSGVALASASSGPGEGALAAVSHCPNGVFGDAGRGLSDAGFSPLTSSSSPPDTGALARGELRRGRVLGLPRLPPEPGEGEGEGSVGVGS